MTKILFNTDRYASKEEVCDVLDRNGILDSDEAAWDGLILDCTDFISFYSLPSNIQEKVRGSYVEYEESLREYYGNDFEIEFEEMLDETLRVMVYTVVNLHDNEAYDAGYGTHFSSRFSNSDETLFFDNGNETSEFLKGTFDILKESGLDPEWV